MPDAGAGCRGSALAWKLLRVGRTALHGAGRDGRSLLKQAGQPADLPPEVSVVIPTRDCLAYLPAALSSIEAQGLRSFEVLVIDDGSLDGTAEWLGARASAVPWLRVIAAAGEGPSAARNRGIAAAHAPLIAFLDADDVWLPGKLDAQLAFHRGRPEVLLSFTDYLHVDPSGAECGTCFEYWPSFRAVILDGRAVRGYRPLERAPQRILAENVVGTSTVVARRDALQNASGFDASLRSAADWDRSAG